MSKKNSVKPIAVVLSGAFVASMATTSAVQAAGNPFGMSDLNAGYQVAMGDKPKTEEGKCGAQKAEEGKCGAKKTEEGKCGEAKCGADKSKEGKCGEAKCGANK